MVVAGGTGAAGWPFAVCASSDATTVGVVRFSLGNKSDKSAGGGGNKRQIIARAEHMEKIGIITPGFLQYTCLLDNNRPADDGSKRQR